MTGLEGDGTCAKAGMKMGSVLISVCGKAVKSHAHAIELLDAQSKAQSMQFTFEVVVQEPREGAGHGSRPVVQSL